MDRFRQTIDQLERDETALESVRSVEYQRSIRRTIGSIYLASLLATIGLVLLAYYILKEMSLREQHAREIREREEWFRVTLTSIGDAVIVTDKNGKITFLNPVAEELTGRALRRARGQDIADVFPIFNELTGAVAQNPVEKVMEERTDGRHGQSHRAQASRRAPHSRSKTAPRPSAMTTASSLASSWCFATRPPSANHRNSCAGQKS